MNVNFFEWLRNGVRQSVLLGVSDAVEQIGVPDETEELHPNMLALLDGKEATSKKKRTTGRRRLGKSLKDMDAKSTGTS